MARIETDPNYTTPTFSRATEPADQFELEDVQQHAAAFSTHDHGNGKGTAVTRVAAGIITAASLAPGSVGTTHLADGAVTTVKIGDQQVATAKLAPAAVQRGQIANGEVLSQHLQLTRSFVGAGSDLALSAGVWTNFITLALDFGVWLLHANLTFLSGGAGSFQGRLLGVSSGGLTYDYVSMKAAGDVESVSLLWMGTLGPDSIHVQANSPIAGSFAYSTSKFVAIKIGNL